MSVLVVMGLVAVRASTARLELAHGCRGRVGVPVDGDAGVFREPYRFDVTRTPNDHVGFGGGGPHFCLGANLARREIRVIFKELLRRLPDIHVTAPPDMLHSAFIHGIKRMPVAFTPAR